MEISRCRTTRSRVVAVAEVRREKEKEELRGIGGCRLRRGGRTCRRWRSIGVTVGRIIRSRREGDYEARILIRMLY